MELKVKKLTDTARIPEKAHRGDLGYDIFADEDISKLEIITKLNLLECLTWLSYETDLNEKTKVQRNDRQ